MSGAANTHVVLRNVESCATEDRATSRVQKYYLAVTRVSDFAENHAHQNVENAMRK